MRTLFLPGAQKSATTTLYRLLSSHPDVVTSDRKEPSTFSIDGLLQPVGDPYPAGMYSDVPSGGYRMDASQSYFSMDGVPELIASRLGRDARFIIALRQPVDRALSAYNYFKNKPEGEKRAGVAHVLPRTLDGMVLEHLIEWEEGEVHSALQDGRIVGRNPSWDRAGWPFRYFHISAYGRHISKLLSLFDRDQFLFLRFIDVSNEQKQVVDSVCQFLDIDPGLVGQEGLATNPTLAYRSEYAHSVMNAVRARFGRLLRLSPRVIRSTARRLETKLLMGRPDAGLPEEIHRQLTKIFEPDIKRTEALTGLDFSHWRTNGAVGSFQA